MFHGFRQCEEDWGRFVYMSLESPSPTIEARINKTETVETGIKDQEQANQHEQGIINLAKDIDLQLPNLPEDQRQKIAEQLKALDTKVDETSIYISKVNALKEGLATIRESVMGITRDQLNQSIADSIDIFMETEAFEKDDEAKVQSALDKFINGQTIPQNADQNILKRYFAYLKQALKQLAEANEGASGSLGDGEMKKVLEGIVKFKTFEVWKTEPVASAPAPTATPPAAPVASTPPEATPPAPPKVEETLDSIKENNIKYPGPETRAIGSDKLETPEQEVTGVEQKSVGKETLRAFLETKEGKGLITAEPVPSADEPKEFSKFLADNKVLDAFRGWAKKPENRKDAQKIALARFGDKPADQDLFVSTLDGGDVGRLKVRSIDGKDSGFRFIQAKPGQTAQPALKLCMSEVINGVASTPQVMVGVDGNLMVKVKGKALNLTTGKMEDDKEGWVSMFYLDSQMQERVAKPKPVPVPAPKPNEKTVVPEAKKAEPTEKKTEALQEAVESNILSQTPTEVLNNEKLMEVAKQTPRVAAAVMANTFTNGPETIQYSNALNGNGDSTEHFASAEKENTENFRTLLTKLGLKPDVVNQIIGDGVELGQDEGGVIERGLDWGGVEADSGKFDAKIRIKRNPSTGKIEEAKLFVAGGNLTVEQVNNIKDATEETPGSGWLGETYHFKEGQGDNVRSFLSTGEQASIGGKGVDLLSGGNPNMALNIQQIQRGSIAWKRLWSSMGAGRSAGKLDL